MEDGSYKINWASLFKQPSCVEYLMLIDEQHHQRKRFITTLSDVNFPIEYKKSICELKIKVKMRATESYFVTNARIFHNCFINFILVFKLTLRSMPANIWSSEDLAKDAKKELGEDETRTKVYYSYKN